jgi:hypothetical protein
MREPTVGGCATGFPHCWKPWSFARHGPSLSFAQRRRLHLHYIASDGLMGE